MATYDAKRLRQMRKDGRLPQRPVPGTRIIRHHVDLDDGRRVSLFVNLDSNLVVLDVVDADPSDLGTEVYRRVV